MSPQPTRPANDDEKDERYRAPALDKGLDILELLSEQAGGLTRAEIVKAMGRGPSEIYRMLERLVARDYVSRSAEGDRFALSMKMFVLAHRHPPVRRLVAHALPLMDAFARDARQSCHLVAPDRDAAIVVAQASCPGNWEFGIRVGTSIDLLTTGSGLTLLAFQGHHEAAETAERWEATEKAKILEGLQSTFESYRQVGYRLGDSGQILGVQDISVPVLTPEGHAIAVLTCPYIQRLEDDPNDTIVRALSLLKATAAKLSLI